MANRKVKNENNPLEEMMEAGLKKLASNIKRNILFMMQIRTNGMRNTHWISLYM
jgi:hypothetical protein